MTGGSSLAKRPPSLRQEDWERPLYVGGVSASDSYFPPPWQVAGLWRTRVRQPARFCRPCWRSPVASRDASREPALSTFKFVLESDHAPRLRAIMLHTASTMIAPMTDMVHPAASLEPYHPISWPTYVPTKAPTMPRIAVSMKTFAAASADRFCAAREDRLRRRARRHQQGPRHHDGVVGRKTRSRRARAQPVSMH